MVDISLPPTLSLQSHETARQKTCLTSHISAGTRILQVKALMTTLLPSEKGRRCDYCLRQPSEDFRLAKCSGCAEFWYCGITCQKMQWEQHHRKLCKRYNRFLASSEYQSLNTTERVDSILLSQLVAAVFPQSEYSIPQPGFSTSVSVFFDLMKGPVVTRRSLPLCRPSNAKQIPLHVVEDVYTRFGNNNFLVHSHLNSCAHGIFPLASRLFNHSCDPNCVAKYSFVGGEPVIMDVVAIKNIAQGEELTLPYLDPALPLQTRQEALFINYGFHCTCPLCSFQKSVSPLPPLPKVPDQKIKMEVELCDFVNSRLFPLDHSPIAVVSNSDSERWALPINLHPLLHADYLPALSEEFSRTSHEGDYIKALASGRTLLALYLVLYPLNYPQIGMHALELAKTAWNAVVTHEQEQGVNAALAAEYADIARHYLDVASGVLELFGPEGDEGGPLEELRVMRSALRA